MSVGKPSKSASIATVLAVVLFGLPLLLILIGLAVTLLTLLANPVTWVVIIIIAAIALAPSN